MNYTFQYFVIYLIITKYDVGNILRVPISFNNRIQFLKITISMKIKNQDSSKLSYNIYTQLKISQNIKNVKS